MQLRLWFTDRGYLHMVSRTDDGAFVTSASGGTDKDAFERLNGELDRRGINIARRGQYGRCGRPLRKQAAAPSAGPAARTCMHARSRTATTCRNT